jgi:hypothetical protein
LNVFSGQQKLINMKKIFLTTMTCISFVIITNGQSTEATVNSKVVLDNAKMKVTEFTAAPGKAVCGPGKHSHAAHLTVLLTDADVTVTLPDGKTVSQKAPAGAAFWSEAETHTVVNSGKSPVRAYIVEVK